jgi:biopolymer transport protein ExbD
MHQAQNITLTVTANRQIYVNTRRVTLNQETRALIDAKAGDKTMVIINADAIVPHGLVVSVMDNARKVGVERFAIATAAT